MSGQLKDLGQFDYGTKPAVLVRVTGPVWTLSKKEILSLIRQPTNPPAVNALLTYLIAKWGSSFFGS